MGDDRVNLLTETLNFLKDHGKRFEDIIWIGDSLGVMPKEVFLEVANATYYDGYGGHNVELSLQLVAKDFWLERREYDGSEWWVFCTTPKLPKPLQASVCPSVVWCGDYVKEEVCEK